MFLFGLAPGGAACGAVPRLAAKRLWRRPPLLRGTGLGLT